MADKRVTVTLEVKDNNATAKIKSFSQQLQSLGKISGLKGLSNLGSTIDGIGKAFSTIKGKASLAVAGITTAVNGFNKLYTASKQSFIDGLSKIGGICKTVVGALGNVAKGFLDIVGKVTGADLSFSGLAQSAIDYEQNMKKVETITGATGKTLKDLGDKATKLGRDTSFTAGQVASGMVEMAQQGWKAKDILKGMNSVTALAIVGNMKLSDASYQVASALNQFGADASEADRYANVMTNTFLSSGATVKDFGGSLKYVGSLAGSMNIPIEQLGTAIGVLGDNGIKGSQAGTALRRVISNLTNPTKTVAAAIKEYNLEGAQQKIVNGDLVGGFKEMSEKLSGLNAEEKANAAYSIAGMYAMSGFLGIVNTSPAKFDEMYQAIKNGNGVYETMNKMLKTVQGQMFLFVSKVQTGAKQIYDAIQGDIVKGMETLNNSLDMLLDGKILGMFSYLANESKKWGKAIATGITDGIKSATSFINSGGLKSILDIGTNIIQGICKGIDNASKNGSLVRGITSFIRQICDFITKNAPQIEKAGKQIIDAIKQGIENNKEQIKGALDALISMMNTWAQGSAEIKAMCGTFAGALIDGFIEQIKIKAKGKGAELWNAFFSDMEPPATASETISNFIAKAFEQGFSEPPKTTLQTVGDWVGNIFKSIFGGEAYAAEVESGGTKAAEGISKGIDQGKGQIETTTNAVGQIFGQSLVTAVQQAQTQLNTAFTGIVNSARTAFINLSNIVRNQMVNSTNIVRNQAVNMSNIFRNQFVNMANIVRNQFVNVSNIVRNQMVNACNIVRNQCVNMANIFRTQFVSMSNVARNQFVNIANIVRNQMVNVGNIIRNQITNAANSVRTQCTNMANIFRNQFVSMANVARNQMVNVSNIIRNQATSWSNIVRNQITNARNTFTSQMLSMAAVARTQMVNISNIVRNQAVNWSNIIRNQASNARNALTSSFMSMAAVARNQMANVLSVVRSYMSQIAAACNRTLTLKVNINKTETTTKKVVVENKPKSLSMPQTSSLSASSYLGTRASAGSVGLGSLVGAVAGSAGSDRAISIEVPVVLEGREIAKASAIYTREELARLEKRKNRKRGE